MPLDIQIEGILFYKSSPVSKVDLLRLCSTDESSLTAGLQTLASRLSTSALRLIITEQEVQLVTVPELDELIESLRRDELKRDIGKAGAETLAIVLYREPITKAEIERIRGVNSGFILRNLLTRGLISRKAKESTYTYHITPALLAHLGITHKTELPEYGSIMNRIDTFTNQVTAEDT